MRPFSSKAQRDSLADLPRLARDHQIAKGHAPFPALLKFP